MRVTKQESELRSQFMKKLKARVPELMAIRVESLRYGGIPDLVITGGRTRGTTWIEFKHATPSFESPGLQELTCNRLAAVGFCRYVVWWESHDIGKKTMVVHPRDISGRKGWLLVPEEVTPGFDHDWLVDWVRQVHRC